MGYTSTRNAAAQPHGVFALVVGPSGAGKDSLLNEARRALAGDDAFCFARRIITRPADGISEDHDAVTPQEFDMRELEGAFCLTWRAHGLAYGLPRDVRIWLSEGRVVVANISRGVIPAAVSLAEKAVVLNVTASPEIIAERLRARGREDEETIASRLTRDAPLTPTRAALFNIRNDGSLESAAAEFIRVLRLQRESGR